MMLTSSAPCPRWPCRMRRRRKMTIIILTLICYSSFIVSRSQCRKGGANTGQPGEAAETRERIVETVAEAGHNAGFANLWVQQCEQGDENHDDPGGRYLATLCEM